MSLLNAVHLEIKCDTFTIHHTFKLSFTAGQKLLGLHCPNKHKQPVGTDRVPCSFCLSIHLSIGDNCLFWINGSRLDQDAIWGGWSGGHKKRCVRWGPRSTIRRTKNGKFGGNIVAQCRICK